MEANQILQSNLLEIIFDGRNKAYGAYDLRKTYNKRISIALFFALILMFGFINCYFIATRLGNSVDTVVQLNTNSRILKNITPEKPKILPKLPAIVSSASLKVSIPRIVKDPLVIDPPPDTKQIENARIDDHSVTGPNEIGIINPPAEIEGSNVASTPVAKHYNSDSTFLSVQIEASFPGGAKKWQRYIQKEILLHIANFTESDYGTCLVRFIVDKNGQISDVQATTMKGTKLAEISVNAIKNGPKWIPAQQNGTIVNSYRVQPIVLLNPDH